MVSVERGGQIEPRDLDGLAAAYRALRGGGDGIRGQAGGFAGAVAFPGPGSEGDAVAADESGWLAMTGVAHGPEPMPGVRPAELEGQWALVAYDRAAHEVTVAVDAGGQQPVYVARRAGCVYVSTSALALARHLRAAPHLPGILTTLRMGMQFGAVTGWEGIERLEPAAELTLSPGRCTARTYWRPEADPLLRSLDMRAATQRATEAVVDTCRAAFAGSGPLWADLTGGFDSRILASALARAGVSFEAETYGEPEEPDVAIAQELSRRAGWAWSRFALPADWAERAGPLVDAALAWGDGHLQVMQLAEVLHVQQQKARRHRRALVGGGIEQFRDHSWFQQPLTAGRSRRVNMRAFVGLACLRPTETEVFAADPTAEVAHDLEERFERWAAPYENDLNTAQLDVMDLYRSAGHFGAYVGASRGIVTAEVPGYFRPIWNTAFSLAPGLRRFHRLQRHMASRLSPELAGVRTADGGPAQPVRLHNAHAFAPFWVRRGRKAAAMARERLWRGGAPSPIPATTGGVQGAARAAMVRRAGLDDAAGRARMRCGPLFEPRRLAVLCENAATLPPRQADMLARILTLELSLEAAGASL